MADELEMMIQHLDEFVQMPEGVELVRREVLRLAISGRLVPQNLDEGNATQLIESIESRKANLVSEGKLKPSRNKVRSTAVAHSFDIPSSWVWTDTLSICSTIVDGDHQPPPRAVSGVPFLVIGDISGGGLDLNTATRFVPVDYFRGLDWAHTPQASDILYTTVGSFGIPVPITTNQEFCFQRHIAMFRPVLPEMQSYLYRFLQSPFAFQHAASAATGIAQKTVPLSGLRSMPIPVPPLGEQRRITAKLDQLFDLIDRLESAHFDQEEQRRRLIAALDRQLEAQLQFRALDDGPLPDFRAGQLMLGQA